MKEYRGPDGERRIWFEPSEIEYAIEDELERAKLYPTVERPAVDIEQFLEGYLRAKLDQYANLDQDVLGVTSFAAGQNPKVEINKDLTDAVFDKGDDNVSLLGRWRATLAHEAAHIVLHRPLFELSKTQANFFRPFGGGNSTDVVIRCFKRNVGFSKGRTDWREFQANRGMAALLMPQRLLKEMSRRILPSIAEVLPEEGSKEALQLVVSTIEVFQVSRQAATIRLQQLGTIVPSGQIQMRTG